MPVTRFAWFAVRGSHHLFPGGVINVYTHKCLYWVFVTEALTVRLSRSIPRVFVTGALTVRLSRSIPRVSVTGALT